MESKQATQVTFGLVVVAVGLMLLAGQFDSHWTIDFRRLWPMIFIVLAVGNLLSKGGFGTGVWFLFLGAIFLLHTHRVLSLRDSWPLFVVAGGISMMFPQKPRDKQAKEGIEGKVQS